MSLFPDTPLPYARGSRTSRDAAVRSERKAETDRKRVLDLLRAVPRGMTDKELQAALNLSGDSERPRRWELEGEGLIYKTQERRGGCFVYRAVPGSAR